jgi:hypothetical protein
MYYYTQRTSQSEQNKYLALPNAPSSSIWKLDKPSSGLWMDGWMNPNSLLILSWGFNFNLVTHPSLVDNRFPLQLGGSIVYIY